MPQQLSDVIKIGPAKVILTPPGSPTGNLGHVSVKGVTVMWKPKTTDAKVSTFGDTAVNTFYIGSELTVEFELAQTNFELMAMAQLATGIGATGVGFGNFAGREVVPVKLEVIPDNPAFTVGPPPATNKNLKFTVHKAVAIGEPEILYTSEGEGNVYKVKFRAQIDDGPTGTSNPDRQLAFWGEV